MAALSNNFSHETYSWGIAFAAVRTTHTAVTHPLAPGRIYSAAGDGYFESSDASDSWCSPEDGLQHRYLVGVAVDPADPDTVIVSSTDGPGSAYSPREAEAYAV